MKLRNTRLDHALTLGSKLRRPALPFVQSGAVSGFFRPMLLQAAALCLRPGPNDTPELLLVRTLTSKRWILPKGWPEEGLTLPEAAAREAWEEGGVRGTIATQPIGSFTYRKIRKDGMTLDCRADVFVLVVDEIHDTYPESSFRKRHWAHPAKAAEMVNEPDLRRLLRNL